MAKKLEMKMEEETLSKAIKLLDHEGILVPGTREYDDIKETVVMWFNSYGAAKVLAMVMDCTKHKESSIEPGKCADWD